jgi:hypothetical protein
MENQKMTLVINKLDVSDEGYYVAVIEFANYKTEALFLIKVEKLPGSNAAHPFLSFSLEKIHIYSSNFC